MRVGGRAARSRLAGAGLALVLLGGLTWVPVGRAVAAPAPATALGWGLNDNGQLGDGTTSDNVIPGPVILPAGTVVAAAAAGVDDSFALTSTGTVLGWGVNGNGQLGDGTTTAHQTAAPVSLPPGTTVTAVAAGGIHTLALTSTGTVLSWGLNTSGQLGDGTTTERDSPVPVSLPPGTHITAIAAGFQDSLALTSTGTVLAWGSNSNGQLGDGTTIDRHTPTVVSLPMGITATRIAAGSSYGLAVTSTGTALAWGSNGTGQLGDGTTMDRHAPVAVTLPAGSTVASVSAGGGQSLAVTSAGGALAWGSNSSGQLGDGTTVDRHSPVAVTLPSGTTVTAVAAGNFHSLAVASAGGALAWGSNGNGRLGDGTTIDRHTPTVVSLPAGATVSAVSAGNGHSLSVAVVPPGDPGTALAAVVGADNALYANQGAGFQALGGYLLSAPAVVGVPTGAGGLSPLYIGVGGDHRLYVRTPELGWRDLAPGLVVGCVDSPGAVVTGSSPGPYALTIACMGGDRALYRWTIPVAAGGLPAITSSADPLGGTLIAGPAVAPINGNLTFFVIGSNHQVFYRTLGRVYTGLPALCTGHLAVVTNTARAPTAYLACHGLDDQLYYSLNTGSDWGPFQPAGGLLIDGPGMALTSAGATVFVEGRNRELFHTVISPDGSSVTPFHNDGGILQFGAGGTGIRSGP